MKLVTALLRLLFFTLIAGLPAGYAGAAEKSIIVFDASGSMWAQINGKARIDIARETIAAVLKDFPADRELGLMAYGHREKGSCTDIELIVPPAAGTSSAISAAVGKINPKGKTPLSAAVKEAAEELKFTEEKATVILVTDGLETCNADPCALGSALEKADVDFTAHVVGFGLTDEEGKQVACLAENTGGKYIQASDAGQLTEALKATVAAAPEPAPTLAPAPEPAKPDYNFAPTLSLSEGADDYSGDITWELHKPKTDGSQGDWVRTEFGRFKGFVEPGTYLVTGRVGEARSTQTVTIEAGKTAEPYFILNAGTLKILPLPSDGAEPDKNAGVEFKYPGGDWYTYGPVTVVVPAGKQTVTVKIGAGQVSESFMLKAGEVLEKAIIAGTGHVLVNAYYIPGTKVDSADTAVEIFEAKQALDGSRKSVAYSYGPDRQFDVPAGDYIVRHKLGGAEIETPFSVKAGETAKIDAVMNAGVVAVKQEGYDGWEILSAAKSIDGSRKAFTYGYGAEWQTTLITGEYVIVSKKPDGTPTETPISVKAGERLEMTVK